MISDPAMVHALNSTVHQRGAASPAPRRKRLNSTERLALLERENFCCHPRNREKIALGLVGSTRV